VSRNSSQTVLAEWNELKEIFANFLTEIGKETPDDKGSDEMTQKPNASGDQTKAQWSFATEAWLEVTYGILSLTC